MSKRDYIITIEGVVSKDFRVTATTDAEAIRRAEYTFKQQTGADNATTTKWNYNATDA